MAPGGGFGGRQSATADSTASEAPVSGAVAPAVSGEAVASGEAGEGEDGRHGIRPPFPWAAIVFSLDHADAPNAAVHC
jgi:hypothetical protein